MCPSGMATVVVSCYLHMELIGPRVKHRDVRLTRHVTRPAFCRELPS
jgi:hypothetical protein